MERKEATRKSCEYYINNLMSVIPVGLDKKPLISWKEFQERRPTMEEVDWWLDKFPEMQLGIVTGKISGIIVVDIEEWGDISWLPKTAIVTTGWGWYHYYYSYVNNFTNKCRIKDLTDIRWDGGYVIAPPSRSSKWPYKWLVKVQPIPFPRHLFEDAEITEYKPMESTYQWFGAWQRNNEMARYIWHLLAKIHPSEWDNIAWRMAEEANVKNDPPLNDWELRAVFESIKNIERRNAKDRWYKKNDADEESVIWKEEDNKVMLIKDIASMSEFQWWDKYSTGIDVFDEAFEGGVEDWDLIVVSWLSGHGKTTFSQTLAVNFAEQGLPVLFFSYEVLVHHLWKKFKEMNIRDDLVIYSVEKHTTGNVGWIEEKIKEAKEKYMTKVVVIDHLGFLVPKSTMSDLSKNYSAYVGQIVRDLKTIAKNEKVIIVLPVHLRKTDNPDMNDLKDSSAISQESDAIFILNREKSMDVNAKELYTDHVKIFLAKNRKTWIAAQGWFHIKDWRMLRDSFYIPITKTETTRRSF